MESLLPFYNQLEMRKTLKYIFSTTFIFFFLSSCREDIKRTVSSDKKSLFTEDIKAYYFKTLDSAIFYMNRMDTLKSVEINRELFIQSRKWYKRNEPLMIAYDYHNYTTVNAPNLLKVEIDDYTDIKKIKPHSYQVIEEVLYGEEPIDRKELHSSITFLKARLPFIKQNHLLYNQRDRHHLKMIRDAVVNIATKGITGFDSPVLANSLQEAIYNYEAIFEMIRIYKETLSIDLFGRWRKEMESTIADLRSGEFDTFDRYIFIKTHTNSQLELINEVANEWRIMRSTSAELNPEATNLFDEDFFNKNMFSPPKSTEPTNQKIALGKRLFNDKRLSSSGNMSCVSCHVPSLAFTDGRPKARGKNGIELLRNTPTLIYAVYQKAFFYDGSADGLEGQIVKVAKNQNEFHMDLEVMEHRVRDDNAYQILFDSVYNGEITNRNIRNAIASYIRNLTPFNSKFDRNIQGKENTLTKEEITGFNLFMGKAACATCHFPPVFNGTVPPKYSETEFENLGVPSDNDFVHPQLDSDPGMFYPYEVEERRSFFKTSTIRNISLTAPYMHNGVYETLEQVMDFYNIAGGQGMNLDVPFQTLPPDSLYLSDDEIQAVIAFMEALTDEMYDESSDL